MKTAEQQYDKVLGVFTFCALIFLLWAINYIHTIVTGQQMRAREARGQFDEISKRKSFSNAVLVEPEAPKIEQQNSRKWRSELIIRNQRQMPFQDKEVLKLESYWLKLSRIGYSYSETENEVELINRNKKEIMKEREVFSVEGQKNPENKPEPEKKGEVEKKMKNLAKGKISLIKKAETAPVDDVEALEKLRKHPKSNRFDLIHQIQSQDEEEVNNNERDVDGTKTFVEPKSEENNRLYSHPQQQQTVISEGTDKKQSKSFQGSSTGFDLLNKRSLPTDILLPKAQKSAEVPIKKLDQKESILGQKEAKQIKAFEPKPEQIPNHPTQKKQQKSIVQKIENKQTEKKEKIETLLPTIKEQPLKQSEAQIKRVKQNTAVEPKADSKIGTAEEYLDKIVKYASTFKVKTEIKTKINNLSGAKSDPKALWLFTESYIETIDTNNYEEVQTFSYRIWDAIIFNFIKNTNMKEGFEKMPPKQRNKQAQKNSINTYIILVNLFRTMGHESIWLGIFGNTLRLLNFIYKKRQPLKSYKQLQLLANNYVTVDGDITAKYLSRLDYLTYFLLGLAMFDPVAAFEQIAERTNQKYYFLNDLKKNYQWSYRQFWCLAEAARNNPVDSYWKIPFWNNALSVIYLPLLENKKNGEKQRDFQFLSQWIFKQVERLTKDMMKFPEMKMLEDQESDQFDGEEFVGAIKTLGRGMDSRAREMKTKNWQDFREKCSIFYYFWRLNT